MNTLNASDALKIDAYRSHGEVLDRLGKTLGLRRRIFGGPEHGGPETDAEYRSRIFKKIDKNNKDENYYKAEQVNADPYIYESDWRVTLDSLRFNHGLGRKPTQIVVRVSNNSDHHTVLELNHAVYDSDQNSIWLTHELLDNWTWVQVWCTTNELPRNTDQTPWLDEVEAL